MKPETVNAGLCDGCGLCVAVCGRGCIAVEDGRAVVTGNGCLECGHCAAICPQGALATAQGTPCALDRSVWPSPEAVEALLRARRSHRRYAPREVDRSDLERLIEAARFAPSGRNLQPFEFVVLHSPGARRDFTDACFDCIRRARRQLAHPLARAIIGLFGDRRVLSPGLRALLDRALRQRAAGEDPLFHQAPVILFVHGPASGATPKDDCCYALFHAILVAEAIGLGSCINGYAEVLIRRYPELLDRLGLPRDRRVYACATFGHPRMRFLREVHRQPARVVWK